MTFVSFAAPRSESELSVMASLLVAHGIPYYVHNRGFGGLYPGLQIPLYNVQRIMVPEVFAEEALSLFDAYRGSYTRDVEGERLRIVDRLRGVAEILLGGWSMPYRYRPFLRGRSESEEHAS